MKLPGDINLIIGCGYGDSRKGYDLFIDTGIETCKYYKRTNHICFLWIGDVDGFSMWPALRDHSAVIIEEVQPHDEIVVGDIVVFDDPTGEHDYIIHRVIETGTDDGGWYAVTVGDNQEESTEWVPWYYTARRDEIWGKARIYIDY